VALGGRATLKQRGHVLAAWSFDRWQRDRARAIAGEEIEAERAVPLERRAVERPEPDGCLVRVNGKLDRVEGVRLQPEAGRKHIADGSCLNVVAGSELGAQVIGGQSRIARHARVDEHRLPDGARRQQEPIEP
jgi:hypothetical protein